MGDVPPERLPKDELQRLREALEWFVKRQKTIEAEVSAAHSGRGAAASEWMREDDRDFRSDLSSAFDKARAALSGTKP